jgi:hypothetical protein
MSCGENIRNAEGGFLSTILCRKGGMGERRRKEDEDEVGKRNRRSRR